MNLITLLIWELLIWGDEEEQGSQLLTEQSAHLDLDNHFCNIVVGIQMFGEKIFKE